MSTGCCRTLGHIHVISTATTHIFGALLGVALAGKTSTRAWMPLRKVWREQRSWNRFLGLVSLCFRRMRVWSSSHLLTIWNIQNCCFWATNCSTTELLCAQFEGDYLWDVQVMPRAALLTKTDPKWTVCPGSSRIKTELFWSILYKFDLSCVHRNIQCTSVHMHGMYVYILLYTSHISLSIRSPWWWGVLSCTSNVAVLEAVACLHVCFWWHWTVIFC